MEQRYEAICTNIDFPFHTTPTPTLTLIKTPSTQTIDDI
jgi:hypothetical protein